ncbi:hypothetical protein M514_20047 [Trichuris suis]|uniref:Uncharacterized protein n=1 Tax=Trichuris suis TaxID=68888 RepID=A0A085NE56_9BILA|nr:hypothetical protein M514_20047 [Trichuris suis]
MGVRLRVSPFVKLPSMRFSNYSQLQNCPEWDASRQVGRVDILNGRNCEFVKTSNGLQCGIGRNVKGPHTAQDRNSECAAIPHGSYGPTGRNLVTSES